MIGIAPFASLGHVKALYVEGVRGVVNLCDEYRGPTEEYSNLGMKHLYLPTGKTGKGPSVFAKKSVENGTDHAVKTPADDHYEPSFADLQKAVAFIEQHAQRNEKVAHLHGVKCFCFC